MEIHLTGRHLKITPAIRNYVREKVEKAQKYFDHIVWAQVVLFIEKRAHKAEIVIHASRQTFRALATASDLYSAIDLGSDKIDAQLKKYKERLRDHHKNPTPEPAAVASPSDGAPWFGSMEFSFVKQPVSPMTNEEAARKLETLGYDFLLFQERKSSQLQVIYRRGDESYGILQPVKKG